MRLGRWIVAMMVAAASAAVAEQPATAPAGQPFTIKVMPGTAVERFRPLVGTGPVEIELIGNSASDAYRAFAAMRAGKMEKAAYLGVTTSPVPPALRAQVKLPKGVGLVVDNVQADSPAAAAGLKQYDIIQKIGDQWAINMNQFTVLVRMHKAGDEVSLSIIREGQPRELAAKLVEKELPALDEPGAWPMAPGGWGGDPGQREQIEKAMRGMLQSVPAGAVQMRMDDGVKVLKWQDPEHTLTLTERKTDKGAEKTFKATDKEGKMLWEGPLDEKSRKELPAEIREKLERLENSGQFEIKFHPATQPGFDRMRMPREMER